MKHCAHVFLFLLLACGPQHKPAVEESNAPFPYPKARAIIDLTKPPYNLDNTGQRDCSDAFIRAFNDVAGSILKRYQATDSILAASDTALGFESKSSRGAVFPHQNWPGSILYLPNGTYKVSKTIGYTIANLQNTQGSEMNRQLRLVGESMEGTIIRLTDHAPGFSEAEPRAVLSFMKKPETAMPSMVGDYPLKGIHGIRGAHSNVAMSNYCENLTIDIGAGNPGAVGLLFHSSNTGAIRNLRIRSSDPEKTGAVGLAITMGKPMGNYTKNVTIEGFDYGVLVHDHMLYSVFEHIQLQGQRKAGIKVKDHPVSIRKLASNNEVPAIHLWGSKGYVALTDSDLSGGNSAEAAVQHDAGFLYLENVDVNGYRKPVSGADVSGNITQFVSHPLEACDGCRPLQLPVEETPYRSWQTDTGAVAYVDDYGALGDGRHDDTEAIQKAMQSGSSTIIFQPGQYLLNGTIEIPASVQRVNFMFCDLKAGTSLADNKPNFRVTGQSDMPLIIEDIFAWEEYFGDFYFMDHASNTRTF